VNERKTRLKIMVMDRPATVSLREWRVADARGQVICLHGIGVSGAEFAPLAACLNAAGLDVLAPDWIGHGDSEYLHNPVAYDWTNYMKCLGAIIQRYHRPKTHYLGTSWGGGMLLLFLLSLRVHPQSAIFVDVPIRMVPELTTHGDVLAVQVSRTFSTVEEGNVFLAQVRPSMARVPDAYKTYFDRERYRLQNGRYAFSFDPAILAHRAGSARWKFDFFNDLKRFSFDTLFAYGAASPHRWPPDYVALNEKSPYITYRDDMAGGHPPMLLFEEQFGMIVDYIKKKTPGL
jgi:pimeloyl-ACP methyl ester carboxylesterase